MATYLRPFRRYAWFAAAVAVTLLLPALVWGAPQTPEGWRLPFDNAEDGLAKMSITQGPWGSFSHAGSLSSGQWAVDYSTAPGTTFPVRAPADGIVWGTLECTPGCTAGVGYVVVLQHADGYFSRFLHLDNNRREVPAVNPSQTTPKPTVKQGDVIGHAWNTGGVPVHLHFEVRRGVNVAEGIHSGVSVPSFEIPGQWWRPCYHPPIPTVGSLVECGEPEAAAYYPVQGTRPVHSQIPIATPLRHLANDVAPPVVHPSYTGPVWSTGTYLHRGSSPNPGGTQTFFATSMYDPASGTYFDLPSTFGFDASTIVGAIPCQSNRYFNWASHPVNGNTFNLISLTPSNCTGTAPHLAAWIDPVNLRSDNGVVLEYASGTGYYIVFQYLRLPSGSLVAYKIHYQGLSTSVPAPGGYTYQVCRVSGSTQCSALVWAGDAEPLWADDFGDGTLQTPNWEDLSDPGCSTCWSAGSLKAAVDIPSHSPDTRAWIVAGDVSWGDYTMVADIQYSDGPDEDIVVRHNPNGSHFNVNVHHFTDSHDIRLFAVDGAGVQHNLVCCPGALVSDLSPNITYRIQVDVRGNRIRVYFGRPTEPLSLRIDHFETNGYVTSTGRIGLRGWTGTYGQEHATFDNVIVFK